MNATAKANTLHGPRTGLAWDPESGEIHYPNSRIVVAQLKAELARREKARRDRWIDAGLEAAIAALTLAALWLITSDSVYARWGYVLGLASQPFYLAATWRARRWGMFIVAGVMCAIWARGIANHFL